MKRLLILTLALSAAACSSPPSAAEVETWRGQQRPRQPSAPLASVAALESLRSGAPSRETLARARWAAVRLADTGQDPEALWRAARAEADLVALLQAEGAPRAERDLASASGLDWVERARAAAGESPSPALLGQLAWSLGGVTHLQPMFDRDDWAVKVQFAAEAALAADPDELAAQATLAMLHLRLATLPWIAKLFASGAPEADLALAERLARACHAARPSLEHALLLAKILAAREQDELARATLREALAEPDRFPRDPALRPGAQALLEEWE